MQFKMLAKIIGTNLILITLLSNVASVQLELQEGEELEHNGVESELNECIAQRTSVGVCFGKEILSKLNKFDETDTFSLAKGVSFMRDDKTPRDIGSFLDKDPMDFRSIIEDASHLISKRSLHWDLSGLYPGLVMRIGPTLANGVLEFVMDPRIKDRTYQQQGEVGTGRLLARNLLVPFLLGFKFQLSTLLPILLGLLLIASKKAFLLAKFALLAVTVFSSGFGGQSPFGLGAPALSSYTSYEPGHPGHYHDHHDHQSSSGYYRRPHNPDYYYREKSIEPSTASPITPDELRNTLERFFVTKKDPQDSREDSIREEKIRNARNFAWTPINTG